jgi:hypothetical protein
MVFVVASRVGSVPLLIERIIAEPRQSLSAFPASTPT